MKTFLITLFAFTSLMIEENSQETLTIEGKYLGFESKMYKFSDKDDYVYAFKDIEGEALEKFDLLDKTLIGENFYVTYRTEIEIDESEEENSIEYEVYIIVDLELIDK